MTDREKLIELIQSAVDGCATYWAGLIADHLIANGVTVQKHGRWVVCYEDWRKQIAGDECSACGFKSFGIGISHYNYCPNCGAKMKTEVEE